MPDVVTGYVHLPEVCTKEGKKSYKNVGVKKRRKKEKQLTMASRVNTR